MASVCTSLSASGSAAVCGVVRETCESGMGGWFSEGPGGEGTPLCMCCSGLAPPRGALQGRLGTKKLINTTGPWERLGADEVIIKP